MNSRIDATTEMIMTVTYGDAEMSITIDLGVAQLPKWAERNAAALAYTVVQMHKAKLKFLEEKAQAANTTGDKP